MTEPRDHGYTFGPFLLDTRERRLLRDGRLLRKEELLRLVWSDAVVEENNLTVTVSALRKALGEGPTDRQYIETVPRHGYRFVADLRARQRRGSGTTCNLASRPP